jgi:hypothetical protein
MAVEVERFDVNSEEQQGAGRPRVACFRVPKEGQIDVRVQRDDGSLWLWALGPAGGERGHIVLAMNRALMAVEFANAIHATDERYGAGPGLSGGSNYALRVRRPWKDRAIDTETTDRLVSVTKGMGMASFTLRFDEAALDELATLMREWGATTLAATEEKPVIGEFFGRGQMPGGTPEQVRAWVQAGPEGRLVRITGSPGDSARAVPGDHVRYAHVARSNGSLGGELEVPLAAFYGDGWRRIG